MVRWHAGTNCFCRIILCYWYLSILVALKILQMLFVTPLSSAKLQGKKKLFVNSQMRESLTMSWGFHFEHCYWERDCDQFSFSWMGDCRRPLIPHWRAQHFAVASHQRHNWGLLSLGRCCIYTNPALPPRNSNGCRLGGAGSLQTLAFCSCQRKQGWRSRMQSASWLWAPPVAS